MSVLRTVLLPVFFLTLLGCPDPPPVSQSDFDALADRVEELESNNAALTQQVQSLEQEVATLSGTTLAEMQSDISSTNADLDDITTRVNTIEADYARTVDLNALRDRVTTVETDYFRSDNIYLWDYNSVYAVTETYNNNNETGSSTSTEQKLFEYQTPDDKVCTLVLLEITMSIETNAGETVGTIRFFGHSSAAEGLASAYMTVYDSYDASTNAAYPSEGVARQQLWVRTDNAQYGLVDASWARIHDKMSWSITQLGCIVL